MSSFLLRLENIDIERNALPGMLEVSRSYQTEILKPSKILSARPTSLYQIFSTTEETKTAKLMFLVSVYLYFSLLLLLLVIWEEIL